MRERIINTMPKNKAPNPGEDLKSTVNVASIKIIKSVGMTPIRHLMYAHFIRYLSRSLFLFSICSRPWLLSLQGSWPFVVVPYPQHRRALFPGC